MVSESSNGAWIAPTKRTPDASLRLFCVPYAGRGASVFRTWSDDLPQSIELAAIQLPGRENRFKEPLFQRIIPLVETLASSLSLHLTRPYALFGHSVGALIAFELARKLRKEAGFGPSHLFVSAYRAPRRANQDPSIHKLPDPQFIEELQHRYDGVPDVIRQKQDLMDLLLPVLRADFALTETYQYSAEEPLDCPITAFGGVEDPNISTEDLTLWGQETNRAFTLQMFPGGHFFLHSHQPLLLRVIAQELLPMLSPASGQPCVSDRSLQS